MQAPSVYRRETIFMTTRYYLELSMVPGYIMLPAQLLVHIESPEFSVQRFLQFLPRLVVPYQGGRGVVVVEPGRWVIIKTVNLDFFRTHHCTSTITRKLLPMIRANI